MAYGCRPQSHSICFYNARNSYTRSQTNFSARLRPYCRWTRSDWHMWRGGQWRRHEARGQTHSVHHWRVFEIESHLSSDGWVSGSSLVLHRILIHALLQTLVQTTGPTLVAMGFVDRTLVSTRAPSLTDVLPVTANWPLYREWATSCQNI